MARERFVIACFPCLGYGRDGYGQRCAHCNGFGQVFVGYDDDLPHPIEENEDESPPSFAD
ncbi:MAG: hypothetical protein KC910_21750 [Candidatus Eremiobacteraeota bacterium]|nr:hypothetical protein [Candidatus Eremiobacteraeota bacterium]